MILSGRRLLWGLNFLLLMAAALTFRPIRTWIDQIVVARALHPNLKVHEIRLSRSPNVHGHFVIQAKHFDWGAPHGERCVGISAESAWLVLEDESLLSKTFNIPRAILKNSRLYLETIPQSARFASLRTLPSSDDVPESLWQRQMESRQGVWQMNDLRQYLDGLLKTDEFAAECASKIDFWLSQGTQLADEAQHLASNKNGWDNPLRSVFDLEERLSRIDQLAENEKKLIAEFQTIQVLISDKIDQIGNEFERQRLPDRHNAAIGAIHDDANGQAIRALASQVIQKSGSQIFEKFSNFAEVADLLCRAALSETNDSHDCDYRAEGQQILSLADLSADGMFRCDPVLCPFSLQAKFNLIHSGGFATDASAEFTYQFDLSSYLVRVSVRNQADSRIANNLRVEIVPNGNLDSSQEIRLENPQWLLSSRDGEISGSLTIDVRISEFLAQGFPEMAKFLRKDGQINGSGLGNNPIRMSFKGDWKSVDFSVSDQEVPDWLMQAIRAIEQQRQLDRESQRLAYVEHYFEKEIERLDSTLNQLLDRARLQSEHNSERMRLARTLLNRKLGEVGQVEFARQPSEDVKR